MESRTFGYCRVSSKEQSLSRQLEAFKKYGINDRDVYIDKISGAKDIGCREQYNILKKVLRENDILIIKSIDRLGRDYNMIVNEWRDITLNIKANIKVLDMEMLDTTRHKDLLGNFISDLILQILSYVSQQEREFIKMRQREGIDICLKEGKKYGRPKISKPSNWNDIISKWKNKELMTKEAVELLGLTYGTFYNLLKIQA